MSRLYDVLGRTYLFNLDSNHLRSRLDHNKPGQVATEEEADKWKTKYCVDAFHAGNVCVD